MKVLQLSTYPIELPLHGGQIRVSQIRNYLENLGYQVLSLSISEKSHESYNEKIDLLVDNHDLNKYISTPLCADLATAYFAENDSRAYKFIVKNVKKFKPTHIFLEQPWLWYFVKKILNSNIVSKDTKIIYSSQNIEFKTKQSLFEKQDIFDSIAIEKIKELEIDLCRNSDYIVAVSQEDKEEFQQYVPSSAKIFVCSNGVARRKINKNINYHLKNDLLGRKIILFIGSAYPPNAIGFWEMLGNLLWVPNSANIIVLGGVSKMLLDYMPKEFELYRQVIENKIILLGFVDDEYLQSFIELSSVIILPITSGGGSNLKTAEAIASGKPVVSTSFACRGFNFANKLSNFIVTDNKVNFISNIDNFINQDYCNEIDSDEKRLREGVFWDNTLVNLRDII